MMSEATSQLGYIPLSLFNQIAKVTYITVYIELYIMIIYLSQLFPIYN